MCIRDRYQSVQNNTRLGRWFNRREPSTAVCLILVLVCLGGGVYMWTDEAPLRQQGVAAIARVVSVEDDAALVEFPDRQGRSVQAYLDSFGTPAVGEAVEVIYDPKMCIRDSNDTAPIPSALAGRASSRTQCG